MTAQVPQSFWALFGTNRVEIESAGESENLNTL
jgi:hypothetical protein